MSKLTISATVSALALVGVVGLSAAPALAATTSGPSAQDVTWMKSNAQGDLAEISIGTLAMSKSSNPGVLNLAQVTKSQHTVVLGKLQALAKSLDVVLPTSPSAAQQALGNQLSGLSGSAFDLTYDMDQIAGHEQSIAETQTEISSGSDASVISFAEYYLPIAQMHLQMAESLHAQLTGSSSPNGINTGTGGGADHSSPAPGILLCIATAGVIGALAAGRRLRRN